MTSITTEHVKGNAGIRRFIEIAPPLYREVPAWVRPLDEQLRARLDPNRNPFWRHAEGALIIARQQGSDVARLLVTYDRLRQECLGENVATFGFFEAPSDPNIAHAIFAEAALWAKRRGVSSLVGPLALSIHEEVGLLVDGFEHPPYVLMPYNREHYHELLIQSGFAPERDFYAYQWNIQDAVIPDARPPRGNVTVRCFNPRRRADEARRFLQVYNDAFAGNWGFVPMTEEEADSAVNDFLRYADIALPRFAEVDGEPAGFILALPDFNQIIRECAGKLWPFGLLRILLKRRSIRNLRVMTLAVRRPFRPLGIAHHLIRQLWETARAKDYQIAEFGYIDASNNAMRNIVERIGAKKVKTYRMYRRSL